jgi:hypothetical protein
MLDGGFFVFGDISIKVAGKHRLNFSLFELRKWVEGHVPNDDAGQKLTGRRDNGEVVFLKSIFSDPFDVVLGKHWRGLVESTHLSRTFSDQGVRLRLRKENRNMAGYESWNSFVMDLKLTSAHRSKRTFPYSPRAGAQAGPQAGPSNFGYEDESNKRQRSNEQVQPQGYSMQERAAIAYDPRAASQSMQSAYTLQQQQQQQQQQASLQSPPTSFGSRTPIANTGWQHAPQVFSTLQGSMSAPARYPESGADSAQGITPSPGAANYALQPASSLTVDPGPPFARRGTDAYMPMTHQHQHQHPQTSPTTPYQTSGEAMYLPTNANMPSASSYSDHEPRQHTQTHSVASPASSTRSGLNPTTTNYPMQQQQQQQLPPQQYATLPDTSHYVYPSYQHRPYQAAPTSLLQQPLSNISDPLGIRSQHQQHALGNPLELHQQQQQQQQPSSPYIHQQQQLPNLSIRQQQPGEPYAQHSQQQQYAADLGQGYSQSGGRAYPTTQPPDQSREF